MKNQRITKEEYEVITYPKLRHVSANAVQVVNRNTHVHRAMEIGLVLEGDGVMRVNDTSFPVHQGSLYFFNANEPHEIIAETQAGVKIAYQMVASSFCAEYISCFRNMELLENDLSACLTAEQQFELTSLLVQSMMHYMDGEGDLYGLHCICSICQLYSKLLEYVPYRQMAEQTYLSRNKKMARLSRITEYIDNNYSEKITLDELANSENVTKTYLSHFIHDNLNMTFQDYVSSVRFEQALKLIRSTSMCLTDISVVCGFSDVKYLSRMLEERFGQPAQACCVQLRRELEQPVKEETQIFATQERGRVWLDNFWKACSSKSHKK